MFMKFQRCLFSNVGFTCACIRVFTCMHDFVYPYMCIYIQIHAAYIYVHIYIYIYLHAYIDLPTKYPLQ